MIRPVIAAVASLLFAVLAAAPASAEVNCQVVEVTAPIVGTVGTKVCPPIG